MKGWLCGPGAPALQSRHAEGPRRIIVETRGRFAGNVAECKRECGTVATGKARPVHFMCFGHTNHPRLICITLIDSFPYTEYPWNVFQEQEKCSSRIIRPKLIRRCTQHPHRFLRFQFISISLKNYNFIILKSELNGNIRYYCVSFLGADKLLQQFI